MGNYCLTKKAREYSGVKTISSINGVRKTRQVHAKNETRPLTYAKE